MKVLSWNTFLAPTMPNRFTRETLIVQQVTEWIHRGFDVILLQEMNSHTIGCIGWLYYRFKIYKYLNITMQRFMDYFLLLEGWICPMFYYEHTELLKESIYNINRQKGTTYSILTSERSRRGIDGGMVTICRYPVTDSFNIKTPTDLIHVPSILGGIYNIAKDQYIVIINAHLLPELSNYTYTYTLVNFLNSIGGINIRDRQIKGVKTVETMIKTITNASCIYLGGDFNIGKGTNQQLYKYFIQKTRLVDSSMHNNLYTQHHIDCEDGELSHERDQIDYIFSTNYPKHVCRRLEGTKHLSDHHPIATEY